MTRFLRRTGFHFAGKRYAGNQPFLAIIVHAFDQRLEALVHQMTLHLARRGDRLAVLLGIERLRQDAEVLDLLRPGELAVGALDLGPWEQVFYAEFDGQREKRVIVKVMGE